MTSTSVYRHGPALFTVNGQYGHHASVTAHGSVRLLARSCWIGRRKTPALEAGQRPIHVRCVGAAAQGYRPDLAFAPGASGTDDDRALGSVYGPRPQ
jgi:hypothetical protein